MKVRLDEAYLPLLGALGVALAVFAVNFAVHHGGVIGNSRIAYYVLVVLCTGTALSIGAMALLPRHVTAFGFTATMEGPKLLVAMTLGAWLMAQSVGTIALASPERTLRLFTWLWMTSVIEVLVFLAIIYNALRAVLSDVLPAWVAGSLAIAVSSVMFGAYHFSYSPPWNTTALATTVALVWLLVCAVFIVSESFWAAVVFNNCMATLGFLRNDIRALDAEPILTGVVLDGILVIIVALAASRLHPVAVGIARHRSSAAPVPSQVAPT